MNMKVVLFYTSIFLMLSVFSALLLSHNQTLHHLLLLQESGLEEASISVVDHIHDLLFFR